MSHSSSRLPPEKQDRIPLLSRDDCDIKLAPLNECRRNSFYAPWMCSQERNDYLHCSYDLIHLNEGKRLAAERKAKAWKPEDDRHAYKSS